MKPLGNDMTDPRFREIMRKGRKISGHREEGDCPDLREEAGGLGVPYESTPLFGARIEPIICARECPYSSVFDPETWTGST